MKSIDLRSDTVTMPTDEMRRAMANALVGDDVYGDDPTVNKLEKIAAEKVGKEAALFVPSGTFGNQLSLLTHTRRGQEVIIGKENHIVVHEVGASAVIAGVQLRTLNTTNGTMSPEDVEKAIRKDDIHQPETGLICIENAHGCGAVIKIDNLKEIKKIAEKYSLPVHMDGARIFNAAISLGVDARDIAKYCDTVMFCLSKGLAAPIGSMVAGNKKFIDKARKNRKLMGGGMRQAGIIAAAGIIALEKMTLRLEEDHKNAKYFASELSKIPGINVRFDKNDINMIFFEMKDNIIPEKTFINKLYEKNIKINKAEDGEYRFVTHAGITKEDIGFVINSIKELAHLTGNLY
ncbi:low-specificity L-threonine aldolase [Acidilutibacter cellobiosedens]|jgi:threonine aldolase|uniref:Low-specificity L-threonine aldolase n=1 Tax=Acidilutibacter cellobiosedens TaxID=2507161 RepID=A0A410QE42_9FIRM|nr:low-specificity L-threonine aldolase [Acidilutibacter cellobiosedens]QAT62312.1 low-specificity L-threonine aldolase [Acidilutibacter cellobiosedens]